MTASPGSVPQNWLRFEEPAIVAGLHLAPVGGRLAGADMADHARLQDRHRRGVVLRVTPQRGVAAGNDEAAPAGQRRLVHPALDAVGILHQSPDLELALDLHRQLAALVDPFDRIARARAGAQVHLVRAQRGEARQRQTGLGALGRSVSGCFGGSTGAGGGGGAGTVGAGAAGACFARLLRVRRAMRLDHRRGLRRMRRLALVRGLRLRLHRTGGLCHRVRRAQQHAAQQQGEPRRRHRNGHCPMRAKPPRAGSSAAAVFSRAGRSPRSAVGVTLLAGVHANRGTQPRRRRP